MYGQSQRREAHQRGIFGLWWNWTIGTGALTALIIMGMFISKVWLPLIAFAIDIAMFAMVRRNRTAEKHVCGLTLFVATWSLFWSAAIMVIINFMNTHWFPRGLFDPEFSNPAIPYISVLIVAPVTMLVTAYTIFRGRNLNFCIECRMRYGSSSERGVLGNIFNQETAFQLKVLLCMSICVSVAGWLYYAFVYINTDMNAPDNFVFRWVPVLIYAGTVAYFGLRYMSLWEYYCQNIDGGALGHGRFTMMRFLVMCGDCILLREPEGDSRDATTDLRLDTPMKLRAPYRQRVSDSDATAYFRNLSGFDHAVVRFMYVNSNFDADNNIFHYACFIEDRDAIDESRLKGEWYTLPQIQRLNGEGRVAPALTAEINRIYTISMAWKTYDRRGRRLHPIKHYKPTFRLRDFRKWDVDLNDSNWLFVANHNEDSRFYRLRRLWRKYVNGVGE